MDPVENPFSPGAGTPPPYLAGRDELQESFSTLIARAQIRNPVQPMVLSGLRGVGKTVLLLGGASLPSKRDGRLPTSKRGLTQICEAS